MYAGVIQHFLRLLIKYPSPLSLSVSFCLSMCLSHCLTLPIYLSLSLSVSFCLALSATVYFSRCLSLLLSLSLSLCLSVSLYHCYSLSLIYIYLSLCAFNLSCSFLVLHVKLCLSQFLFLSHSFPLPPFPVVCIGVPPCCHIFPFNIHGVLIAC